MHIHMQSAAVEVGNDSTRRADQHAVAQESPTAGKLCFGTNACLCTVGAEKAAAGAKESVAVASAAQSVIEPPPIVDLMA